MTNAARTITTATTLDYVTVWRRLPIPGRPAIDIRERASADSTVTYRFTGHRAAGALTITPAYANDIEAIPTSIRLRLGVHGPATNYRSETRDELPTINTVTLHGETPPSTPANTSPAPARDCTSPAPANAKSRTGPTTTSAGYSPPSSAAT